MFLACGNKPNPAKEEAYQKAASVFAADESFYPILDEELYYFTTQTLDSITPLYINEQDAVKKLMNEETWLAFTTRAFTEKEFQNLKDRRFLPRAIPIAYDGLAIIVNNQNPDSCITIKDFARVLKGEVEQWSDLYPQNKLGVIDVVFDNPLSSTVRWCVDSILDGQQFNAKNIGAVQTSAAVIDYVEKHENALGIIGSNWLNDKRDTTNVTFKKNISVMGVSKMDSALQDGQCQALQQLETLSVLSIQRQLPPSPYDLRPAQRHPSQRHPHSLHAFHPTAKRPDDYPPLRTAAAISQYERA